MEPQDQKRCYALETLAKAKRTIAGGAQEFLACRARIEKYYKQDPARAQNAYLELKKAVSSILSALREAQLSLAEAEEYELADTAGKLCGGLAGYDLMRQNYLEVCRVLTGFAERLPGGENTVSAAIIGRLMNHVRMGYYPTDPENIDRIVDTLRFPAGSTTNLLDPCCGCGKALRQIAEGNNCYAYGVELDELRAEEAQTRLTRVGVGSFFHSRISSEAFHLLFLNPPYLSVMTEGGARTRHEKRFLIESMPHLMQGGVLIYVIPYYRLTPDICKILADNFTRLSVRRFTDGEFKRFRQVAVMGIRKKREDDPATAEWLERIACAPASLPVLGDPGQELYDVPDVERHVEVFKGERFNEKELERQLSHSDSIRQMMNAHAEADASVRRPLLPLSIGQIGLVGGSGLINGLVSCETPHIIKGRIVKVRRSEREEKYNTRGLHTGAEVREVVSNKMVFHVLTPEGFRALT